MIPGLLKGFPKIERKERHYYLFLGVIAGLNIKEILQILEPVFNADIFKRKILIARLAAAAPSWSKDEIEELFEEIFLLIDSLDTYHKKESASLAMMAICLFLSEKNRRKILTFFLTSVYTNNRKRAYAYLLQNWSKEYEGIVVGAWRTYGDEEAVRIFVNHATQDFLVQNFDELMDFFSDEDIEYDFWLRIYRNKFFSRIAKRILKVIIELKKKEPISYISIMKDSGQAIDPRLALEIYKKNPDKRYLPRWYGEMGLWKDLIKLDPNILK